MRLKAFELLIDRRNDVLKLVENRIQYYRRVLNELNSSEQGDQSEIVLDFCRSQFHDTLILYHQAKGVAFGALADVMLETYWAVCNELSIKQGGTKEEVAVICRGDSTVWQCSLVQRTGEFRQK